MAEKVEAYLNSKKNSIKQTEIAESVQILEKLYVKKLWNQITDETLKLVYDSNFVKVVDLKEFYDNFIREFELRINSLKLVQIIIPIAGHIFQKNGFDASMQFLQKFEKTVAKNPEASIRLKSAQIEVLLKNKDSNGAVLNIQNKLEYTQKKLEAEYIFNELKKDDKMAKTLFQIKQFYSLNAFADELSNFFEIGLDDGFLSTANFGEWLELLDKAVQRVQLQSIQQAKYNGLKKMEAGRLKVKSVLKEEEDVSNDDDKDVPDNNWTVEIADQTQPWLFSLECQLPWPLDHIFGEDLFVVLRRCLEKCQTLFHSYKTIIRLLQRNYFGDCRRRKYFDNNLCRKQRLLARNFMESMGVVYSVIRSYIENEIEQRSSKILSAKSFEDIVQLVEKWQIEFEHFLDSETLASGSYIHAAIEALCVLIDKFNEQEEKNRARRNRNEFLSLNSSTFPHLTPQTPSRDLTGPLFSSTPARYSSSLSLNIPRQSASNRFNITPQQNRRGSNWIVPSPSLSILGGHHQNNIMTASSNLSLSSVNETLNQQEKDALAQETAKNLRQIESLWKKLNRIQNMLAVAAEAPFTVDSRSVIYCISVLLPSNINPYEPYF